MNESDAEEYWGPAAFALFYEGEPYRISEMHDLCRKLDEALGVNTFKDYLNRPAVKDFSLAEDMKQLLVALAGPHGMTLLQVYRARKGLTPWRSI